MAYKPYPISTSDTNYQTTIADLKRMENSKISNKIIFGTDSTLKVTAKSTPNMSVDVSSGLCISAGLYNYSSTSVNIPIESNTASYPRIDAIVVYLNGISSCIKVLKGTAAATPSSPVCTSNTYIKLAEVYVGAGVSSIQSSNITDCRAKDGQHIIESLSDLIFTMESNLNSLITKVNAPSQVTTLGTYPYSPTTLEAIPNKIYRIEGNTKADVRGMELSKMKDGDKIYFSVETDVGTLTLPKLSNNFWLPSDSYTCPRDKVVCMIMINGVMRLLE